MALATYADLQTAITSWLARSGDTELVSAAPDLIALAEARMYFGASEPGQKFYSPAVRCRAMESQGVILLQAQQDGSTSGGSANAQTVTLSSAPTLARGLTIGFTAGLSNTAAMTLNPNSVGATAVKKNAARDDLVANDVSAGGQYGAYHDGTQFVLTPGQGYAPLPSDWLEGRSMFIQGSPERELDQITSYADTLLYDSTTPAKPEAYAIEGDLVRFLPFPNDTYSVKVNYYKKFPALSSSVNWIMTNKPDIYLYGSLLEAAVYSMDDNDAEKFHALYSAACSGLIASEKRARFSGAPLRIRVGGMVV